MVRCILNKRGYIYFSYIANLSFQSDEGVFLFQADLQAKGKIKLFKLGGEETALVVIFTFDLINHVLKCCGNASKIDHYLKNVMTQIEDISIDKEVLRERFNLSEDDIRSVQSILESYLLLWRM